jgi:hypothetical protein
MIYSVVVNGYVIMTAWCVCRPAGKLLTAHGGGGRGAAESGGTWGCATARKRGQPEFFTGPPATRRVVNLNYYPWIDRQMEWDALALNGLALTTMCSAGRVNPLPNATGWAPASVSVRRTISYLARAVIPSHSHAPHEACTV